MKRYLFLLITLISFGVRAQLPSYSERVAAYVRQHKAWAQAEQQRCGIPAAITLAQGIHETEAGASELATVANNHFGIKCRKEWTGETFAHDDDAPQECFRKYGSALESYRDHSDYLKSGKRYQSCFCLDARDYAGWARELRKCGYATNPVYATKLIKIIEDYHLQDYTLAALNPMAQSSLIVSAASPVAAVMMAEEKQSAPGEVIPDKDTPVDEPVYGKVVKKDGQRGFWAHRGDVLLEYAIQYKVRYAKLLEMNNLPDAPLAQDQFVYLEHGGTMEHMMAKDASSAIAEPAAAPTPAASSPAAPIAVQEVAATAAVASKPIAAQHPVEISAAEAASAAEARIMGESVPAHAVTPSVAKPAETTKPFNIAAESAVEEQKPAEPQDEFSRLKSRFDKVVYSPAAKPTPVAATATPAVEKPVAAANTAGEKFHVVKSGETAFGIAKQHGITMQQLMDLNKLSFGAGIKVGQKLRVK